MDTLLSRNYSEVIVFSSYIFDSLRSALSDSSDEVVLLVLEVHAGIAKDYQHFHQLLVHLIDNFRNDNSLLEKRGSLIVRRLCMLLGPEKIYREFSTILEKDRDLDFASIMVQALNLILLTSVELADIRALLMNSMVDQNGERLFFALYSSWCHSPMATISLCFLGQAYRHASCVIRSLGEEDINVKFLVQLDKLIRLLETPIFTYLRLQLLEPVKYPWLLKSLYGLLMLLPQQSTAFGILRTRLKAVRSYSLNSELRWSSSGNTSNHLVEDKNRDSGDCCVDASKLQQFVHLQQQHRMHAKSKVKKTCLSKASSLPQEDGSPEVARVPSPAPDLLQPPSKGLRIIPPGSLQQ